MDRFKDAHSSKVLRQEKYTRPGVTYRPHVALVLALVPLQNILTNWKLFKRPGVTCRPHVALALALVPLQNILTNWKLFQWKFTFQKT